MEKFFWADAIAGKIIKEKKARKSGRNKTYVCASGITPSGSIHIGNFREVITTELVVRALKDKGARTRFVYSWDDFDRFRKVPSNVPKSYEKYIGMPLSEVPSPFPGESGKGKSYAEHFEKIFEASLGKVGVKPEFIRQNAMNKKRKYWKQIKIALDNKDKIRKILNEHRKEPLPESWIPLTVYCEKCGKDFTKILSVAGYEIEYECKCGHASKIDYRKKGIVKLPWRVDWPARWDFEGVDFEPGGIDHSTPGGSFSTAKEIVKVFGSEAPIYQLYEWVRIKGGTEFSSSSGNATTLDDVEEIYEPEVLRYLFVGTRPGKGFQISFDNDVIKIYEDYDALEKRYYSRDSEMTPQEKRIYELSQVNLGKPRKTRPKRISFRHLVSLVQLGKGKIDGENKERAERVKNWISKYASDDFKFSLQEKVPKNLKLTGNERKALAELRIFLEKSGKKIDEKKLFDEFYNICGRNEIKNSEFFGAAYKIILGKTKGPRLAALISDVGKDKIIKLLKQVK